MALWSVVGVDLSVPWPTSDTEIEFSGRKMTLRPGSKEFVPTNAFEYPPALTFDDALVIVSPFMSSLAWVERWAVGEEGVTGGSHPIRIGWPLKSHVITLGKTTFPHLKTGGGRLALALYREAFGLNSIVHAFLSFFKDHQPREDDRTGAEGLDRCRFVPHQGSPRGRDRVQSPVSGHCVA